jgi:HPt (histidine-containing phosphotransfer) domain-containing protein
MRGELSDVPTKLQELTELAGVDTARHMAQMLVLEIENIVPKILELVEQSNLAAASNFAHGLAGISASVGCSELAQVARSLESGLRAGNFNPDLTSQICFAATEANLDLHAFLTQSNPAGFSVRQTGARSA